MLAACNSVFAASSCGCIKLFPPSLSVAQLNWAHVKGALGRNGYPFPFTDFLSLNILRQFWAQRTVSPISLERARPYVGASERKLRDVGFFFGTSSKSKEEIKKFQRERVSKQSIYISIRAFSKIRILSWETGYLASISTASSPLKTKSSDHFNDLHKPRLLTKFHDNPTSPVKVVPKWKSVLRCSQCSFHSLALPRFQFENCRS